VIEHHSHTTVKEHRMLASPYSAVAVMVVCSSFLAHPRLDAQATPTSSERGCRGDEISITVDVLGSMADFPVITVVPPGTPAALAGLHAGDSVVSLGGRDSRERPTKPLPFFAPGDTLKMTVRRGQTDLPIVLVFGRTLVERSGGATTRECRPVTAPPTPADEHSSR
jgi:membrane-associated protease RseP (regulator of RpoE activity)